MILRRRLWSLCVFYLVFLDMFIWIGGARINWPPEARAVGLALVLISAGGLLFLVELVFIRPLRQRLRRIDDLIRTMDPTPAVPRIRGMDELDQIRADLRKAFRRLDETRGDLAVKRIRAEVDSQTDPLTKLQNHRSFLRLLDEGWERAQRARAPLALLIIDVDRFKSINDQLGHLAGNEALETVAGLIKESTRLTDLVFRYAGDEFAVLLPRTGLGQAVLVAEKIRQRVGTCRIERENGGFQLSVSIGAAERRDGMRTAEELVQAADRALYYSKETGRNSVAYPVENGFRIFKPD